MLQKYQRLKIVNVLPKEYFILCNSNKSVKDILIHINRFESKVLLLKENRLKGIICNLNCIVLDHALVEGKDNKTISTLELRHAEVENVL